MIHMERKTSFLNHMNQTPSNESILSISSFSLKLGSENPWDDSKKNKKNKKTFFQTLSDFSLHVQVALQIMLQSHNSARAKCLVLLHCRTFSPFTNVFELINLKIFFIIKCVNILFIIAIWNYYLSKIFSGMWNSVSAIIFLEMQEKLLVYHT